MSKVSLIASAAGTGVVATGIGTAAATGSFSSGKVGPTTGTIQNPFANIPASTIPDNIKLTNFESFKKHNSQLPCANKMFNNVDWNDGVSEDLSNVSKFDGTKEQACLDVWWDKETYNNGKWKGNWNLFWALKNDTDGIILFSSVTAESGKLEVRAETYSMKKNSEKWSISGKKVATVKDIEESKIDWLVIKSGYLVKKEPDYLWGFTFEKRNVCASEGECKGNPKNKSFSKKSWDFVRKDKGKTTDDDASLNSWSNNISFWNENNEGLFSGINRETYASVMGHFQLTHYSSSDKK